MPRVQFYLAFANQLQSPLPELAREARALRGIVRVAAERGLCNPLMDDHLREYCRVDDLFAMFQGRPGEGQVGVLHFAGHGSPTFLDFSPPGPGPALAHA